MDEVTFKSDTVLSDVHLYTPNQRHLMVRLNGMGQPGKIQVWVKQLAACGAFIFTYFFWGKDCIVYHHPYPSPLFNKNFIAKTDKTKFTYKI